MQAVVGLLLEKNDGKGKSKQRRCGGQENRFPCTDRLYGNNVCNGSYPIRQYSRSDDQREVAIARIPEVIT